MFRKFLYELLDNKTEFTSEMHYKINFPESIYNNREMCQDLLEDFENQVRSLAYKMGIKLEEL